MDEKKKESNIIIKPYENKYMDKLIRITNQNQQKWFSNEVNWIESKTIEIAQSINTISDEYHHLTTLYTNQINNLTAKLKKKNDFNSNSDSNSDSDSESESECDFSREDILNEYNVEKKELNSKLFLLENKKKNILNDSVDIVMNKEIQIKLKSLFDNYIIESSPNGNIIMKFNYIKNGFSYFSDKQMTYPYLLIACRKYVCTYNCTPLYTEYCFDEKEKEDRKEKDDETKKTHHIKFIYEGILKNYSILKQGYKPQLTFAEFKKIRLNSIKL
jgi:predicted nucleotidyltransferase